MSTSKMLRNSGMIAALLAPGAMSSQAWAQATPVEYAGGLEEIVVTAQKRSENLQDVPISVQAFNQEALEASGIVSAENLPAIVPGMTFGRSGGGSVAFIRGIGATDTSAGQEAPVAFYVDGVYRQGLYTNNMSLKNVERIEVLKGPQGTLFGRNATGGLVHIITKQPSTTPEGEMSFTVGNYETYEASAYATTGLAENLAMDFTGYVRRQKRGYGRNLLTGNANAFRNENTVSTKLAYLGESTEVTLSADYSRVEDPRGFNREVLPGFVSSGGSRYNGRFYRTQHNVDTEVINRTYGGSLQIDHDFGGVELVSISAYRHDRTNAVLDNDLSPAPITRGVLEYNTKIFTEEARLAGELGSGHNWIVGVFYLQSKAGPDINVFAGPTGFLAADFVSRVKTKSYSAFAEMRFKLSDKDSITVGGRYTIDKRSTFGTIGGNETSVSGDKSTWKEPTWRLVYDHQFTDDVMAYASYNRGFKSGNYNTIPLNSPSYDPEIVDAFEVGTKMDLWDKRLRINLASFFYKYRDLQVRVIQSIGTFTINAATAEIKGLEGEVSAKLNDYVTLNAAGAYVDAKYKKFDRAFQWVPAIVGQSCINPVTGLPGPVRNGGNCAAFIDASGNQMIRSPKFSGNIGGVVTVPSSAGEFSGTARLSYRSSFPWDPSGRIREDSNVLLNLGLGFESASKSWGIRLQAENVLGSKYAIYGGSVEEADYFSAGTPATYSVTLDFRF